MTNFISHLSTFPVNVSDAVTLYLESCFGTQVSSLTWFLCIYMYVHYTFPGTLGPDCLNVCQNYNPCENFATCHGPSFGKTANYKCECGTLTSGHYCETVVQPCTASWYGFPRCGPCNCTLELGFNPNCNKTTGICSSLKHHLLILILV